MSPRTAPRFRPAGAATPLIEATAGAASSVVFGLASFVRRARVFHPDGVAFSATVDIEGGLGSVAKGRHDAVVRFSRGAGLPESLPDILGLAIRLVDVHGPGLHQDLLLVTSGSRPGLRHALVPGRSFGHGRWSSLLPYEIAGRRRVVFGARPATPALDRARRLDDLRGIVADGAAVRFVLEVAETSGGWDEVGTLTIARVLTEDENEALRFNPANTGGGIAPIGVLQTVRRRAYLGSQRGRPAPG